MTSPSAGHAKETVAGLTPLTEDVDLQKLSQAKLLAADLDKTVYPNGMGNATTDPKPEAKEEFDKNIEGFMDFINNGGLAIPVTGNSPAQAQQKFNRSRVEWSVEEHPGVFCNGALVLGVGGVVEYSAPIPSMVMKQLTEWAARSDGVFEFEGQNYPFAVNCMTKNRVFYLPPAKINPESQQIADGWASMQLMENDTFEAEFDWHDFWSETPAYQVNILLKSKDDLLKQYPEMGEDAASKITKIQAALLQDLEGYIGKLTSTGCQGKHVLAPWCETNIVVCGVNKGQSLNRFIHCPSVKEKVGVLNVGTDVIVAGDAANDLPMFLEWSRVDNFNGETLEKTDRPQFRVIMPDAEDDKLLKEANLKVKVHEVLAAITTMQAKTQTDSLASHTAGHQAEAQSKKPTRGVQAALWQFVATRVVLLLQLRPKQKPTRMGALTQWLRDHLSDWAGWLVTLPWESIFGYIIAMECFKGLQFSMEAGATSAWYVVCVFNALKRIVLCLRLGGFAAGLVKTSILPIARKVFHCHLDIMRVTHNEFVQREGKEFFDFRSPCGDIKTENFFSDLVNPIGLMTILLKFINDPERDKLDEEDSYVVINFDNQTHDKTTLYTELKNRARAKIYELMGVSRLSHSSQKRVKLVIGFVYEKVPDGGTRKIRIFTIKETDLKKCKDWMDKDKERAKADKLLCGGKDFEDLINNFNKRNSRWTAIENVFVKNWFNANDPTQGGLFYIEVPEISESKPSVLPDFELNETVECRDGDDEEWTKGAVTSVFPLRVRPTECHCNDSFEWEQVRKIKEAWSKPVHYAQGKYKEKICSVLRRQEVTGLDVIKTRNNQNMTLDELNEFVGDKQSLFPITLKLTNDDYVQKLSAL